VPRFAIAPLGLTTEGSTKFKLKGWKCYLKKLQCRVGEGWLIGSRSEMRPWRHGRVRAALLVPLPPCPVAVCADELQATPHSFKQVQITAISVIYTVWILLNSLIISFPKPQSCSLIHCHIIGSSIRSLNLYKYSLAFSPKMRCFDSLLTFINCRRIPLKSTVPWTNRTFGLRLHSHF